MATKKSALEAPVGVPASLSTPERNKYLGRVKTSLAKTWSLSRAETISGATQLAWFLLALGRDDEARALVDLVADGAPREGDRAMTAAALSAAALAARLARLGNDEARRATLAARLASAATKTTLAEAEKDVRSAEVDPSQKHACQGFAQGCSRAACAREAAVPGLDVEAVERIIAQGLDGLRAQLSR